MAVPKTHLDQGEYFTGYQAVKDQRRGVPQMGVCGTMVLDSSGAGRSGTPNQRLKRGPLNLIGSPSMHAPIVRSEPFDQRHDGSSN